MAGLGRRAQGVVVFHDDDACVPGEKGGKKKKGGVGGERSGDPFLSGVVHGVGNAPRAAANDGCTFRVRSFQRAFGDICIVVVVFFFLFFLLWRPSAEGGGGGGADLLRVGTGSVAPGLLYSSVRVPSEPPWWNRRRRRDQGEQCSLSPSSSSSS